VSRLRDQRGTATLSELLVAMVMFSVVLGAVIGIYTTFLKTNSDLQKRDIAQDGARTAADRLARQLRNLASPTQSQPQVVDVAQPYDLVFKTINPSGAGTAPNTANVERVRWCLNTADPNNELLYMQSQTWSSANPPAVPSTSSCPSGAWGNQQVLADHLTNRSGGQSRPLFSYDALLPSDLGSVHVDLYVDAKVGAGPPETHLSTGAFLRNENRPPTAAFTATPSGSGTIVLNASGSADPEGQPLTYTWLDGTTTIGSGITFTYTVTRGTTHSISLQVLDPGGLEGDAGPTSVTG
jgi:hypothetical protein